MGENKRNNQQKAPGLRKTLSKDLSGSGYFTEMKSDLKSLKEFYLTYEQKRILNEKKWYSRWFFLTWWILKGMILKLTPLRRILLIIGILFLLSSKMHSGDIDISSATSRGIFGGVVILFVLMLELRDKLLASEELNAGRKIQKELMPDENPVIAGWDVWMYSKPANEISGDLIDYVEVIDNKFALFLADVAGKGLKAALFTTKLQASIRTLIYDLRLDKLVSKVNEIFFKEKYRYVFASLLYFEVSPNENKIEYINAGHLPPVILRTSGIEELQKGNAAIGLLRTENYLVNSIMMNEGDFFIVFSDGVTEAMNNSGSLYGKDRFFKFISVLRHLSSKDLGEGILKEIEKFLDYDNPTDDLSLIIMKKTSIKPEP